MKLWFERGAWASKKAAEKLAQYNPEDINSIAVIRHAALGDMVLVRAFIYELKKHFPNAAITLSIVSNYTYGVPDDLVDRVHTIYGSDQKEVSVLKQIRRAKELGYHDFIFDLAATSRSLWVCKLNKAGLKFGFPYHVFHRALFYDIAIFRSDFKFEAELMLDMLNLIGCKTDYPPKFNLPCGDNSRKKPYVIYFTSASNESKCWPYENFSELINRLAESYQDYEHVILEGNAEWESIDSILVSLKDNKNVSALRNLTLEQVTSELKNASLVICNDTGIRNLAISIETPTLGIFYSTVPFRYWPRYGKHDVVFEMDGSIPGVEKTYNAAINLLG